MPSDNKTKVRYAAMSVNYTCFFVLYEVPMMDSFNLKHAANPSDGEYQVVFRLMI